MVTETVVDENILDYEQLDEFMNNSNNNNGWYTYWSGSWPCLCSGEWMLYHNGEKIDVEIPFQGEPADTYGSYSQWSFGGESGWDEELEFYEDGLCEEAWIEENIEYLKKVTNDDEQYGYIYKAFQVSDFRIGSCGGCI